jgi:hypothetical protein
MAHHRPITALMSHELEHMARRDDGIVLDDYKGLS